jgi:hypothetical protein
MKVLKTEKDREFILEMVMLKWNYLRNFLAVFVEAREMCKDLRLYFHEERNRRISIRSELDNQSIENKRILCGEHR